MIYLSMLQLTPTEWRDNAIMFLLLVIGTMLITIYYRSTARDRKQHDILRQIIEQLGETTPNDGDGGVHHAEMVTYLVSFIQQTPCFSAKRKATEHLLFLVCTDRIIEFEIVLQIHEFLVRGSMPKVIKKLQKDKKRRVTMEEYALMSWYKGETAFQDIRSFCPPN